MSDEHEWHTGPMPGPGWYFIEDLAEAFGSEALWCEPAAPNVVTWGHFQDRTIWSLSETLAFIGSSDTVETCRWRPDLARVTEAQALHHLANSTIGGLTSPLPGAEGKLHVLADDQSGPVQLHEATPEVDERLVAVLEDLLAQAKRGEILGMVVCNVRLGHDYGTIVGGDFDAFTMIGHLEAAKLRVAAARLDGVFDDE